MSAETLESIVCETPYHIGENQLDLFLDFAMKMYQNRDRPESRDFNDPSIAFHKMSIKSKAAIYTGLRQRAKSNLNSYNFEMGQLYNQAATYFRQYFVVVHSNGFLHIDRNSMNFERGNLVLVKGNQTQ